MLGPLKTAVFTLLFAYLGLVVFALLMANRMIFPAPPSSYSDSDQIRKFVFDESGASVSVLFLANPQAEQLVFYHHGNGEDLGSIVDRLKVLHSMGFAVIAWDYPGYGTSDRQRPNERLVLQIADALMRDLPQSTGFSAAQTILYGRSLGGGPAVWLATRYPCAGLILEGTFTSTFRVMTRIRLLPWDVFNNLGRIAAIRCPVLLLHGNADRVVPFSHSQQLLDAAPEPKMFTWFDGGGHNNLIEDFPEFYSSSIRRFVRDLPRQSPAD